MMKIKFSGVKWLHAGFRAPPSLPPDRKRPVSCGRFTGVGFKVVVFQREFFILIKAGERPGKNAVTTVTLETKKGWNVAAFIAIPRKT